MGILSKLTGSTIGGALMGPVGAVGGALLGSSSKGKSLLGKGKDLLFGSESSPAGYIDLPADVKATQEQARAMQRSGMSALSNYVSQPVEGIARSQIQSSLRGLGQERADTSRLLGQRLAQQGLGKSSIGISALRGLDQNIAQRASAERASLGDRIRGLQMQNIQSQISMGSGVLGVPGAIGQYQQAERKPGIAGLLGAAVGGAYGGAAGAQMGYGAGTGLSAQFGR
jgi:hypothetical protein